MKLRIRSLKTKETIRIEISDSSSLTDLKTLISNSISISSEAINISLNQKDKLISFSPNESLKSLGLTSGDLLFYDEIPNLPPISEPRRKSSDFDTDNASITTSISCPVEELKSNAENSKPPNCDLIEEMDVQFEKLENSALNETVESETWNMEIETSSMERERASSVPYLFKRVLESEKEEMRENLDFFVVAAHAVFLESGFVVCNGNGIHLPKNRNLSPRVVSIQYTLPKLLDQKDVEVAHLKFNVLKNHVSIYGNLREERDVYRVGLEMSKVMPFVVYLSGRVSEEEEKEIFKFWKCVKDGLCLPLLIDICHRNGLPPPPCFARLPTELKYMILERLPGVDVVKTACTCSEMSYITLDEELWKKKFYEEFGTGNEKEVARFNTWKAKYKIIWIRRSNARKRSFQVNRHGSRRFVPRYPAPPRFPFVSGDYDRFPIFMRNVTPGVGNPYSASRRNFSPRCNLGGGNSFV